MKDRVQRAVCLTFIAASLLFLLTQITQGSAGADSDGMPASRLPTMYVTLMAIASLVLFIKASYQLIPGVSVPLAWQRTLQVQIVIILYAGLFYLFGFIAAGTGLLFVLQWVMGQRRWSILLALSLLPPPLLWLISTRLLGVALP